MAEMVYIFAKTSPTFARTIHAAAESADIRVFQVLGFSVQCLIAFPYFQHDLLFSVRQFRSLALCLCFRAACLAPGAEAVKQRYINPHADAAADNGLLGRYLRDRRVAAVAG